MPESTFDVYAYARRLILPSLALQSHPFVIQRPGAGGTSSTAWKMTVERGPSLLVRFFSDIGRARRSASALKHLERHDLPAPRLKHSDLGFMNRFARHNTKPVRFNAANRHLYGRSIDHLILVSESVRESFRPFLEAGLLTGEKISVIHSAYRAEIFHDGVSSDRARRELRLEGRHPILGVLARLVEDKGHTYLFQALEKVRARHPSALLLVAGLGPLESRLRAEAERRGLGDAVRFLGFRDDPAEITALLDVAILPSVGCDASSASIKEAMAMARPVVATDVGGAREILDDGVTGLVVPPADPSALAAAILSLVEEATRAREMGARARASVTSRFGAHLLAGSELAVYERLRR